MRSFILLINLITGFSLFGQSTTVVISEVYGGGGATTGTVPFKNDYVELYNMTDKDIEMKDWSVQYNSATGANAYQFNVFSGTIKAKSYFLIQLGGGAIGGELPTPDFSGSLNLSATNGKVGLTSTNTALPANSLSVGEGIIDFVGYGTANAFEGPAAATALTNSTSLERRANASSTAETMMPGGADNQEGNGFDTNNNSTDFIRISKPDPQNSKSPAEGRGFKSPSLVISTSTVNFGNVSGGQSSSPIPVKMIPINLTKIVYLNVSEDFLISKTSSGPFSDSIFYEPSELNNSRDIYLIFTPMETGLSTGQLTITSSEITNPVIINLTGNGLQAGEYIFDFTNCATTLSDGFTQFSVKGNQLWGCTTFGRDATDPTGKANKPNAIQISGFQTMANENEDWLFSPELVLSGNPSVYPTLSFYSRTRFNGQTLEIRVAENFSSHQNPTSSTVKWDTLDAKLPAIDSDTWTLVPSVDLSKYRGKKITLAWVYQSNTIDAPRWTLDDIRIDNATTPVSGQLNISSKSVYFGYLPVNSTAFDSVKIEANPFGDDLTLSASAPYALSIDKTTYSENLTIKSNQNKINNMVYIRASPKISDISYIDTIKIKVDNNEINRITVNSNTINPENTLDIINYNIEWFGGANGPVNNSLQVINTGNLLQKMNADVFGLSEIIDTNALKRLTENLGINKEDFGYYVSKYTSNASNPTSGNYASGQKLAFIYRTKNIKPISFEPLFYTTDVTSPDYINWSSGRFPLMMKAELTLSGIKKEINFILIHGKAQNSSNAHQRRRNAAQSLHEYIETTLKDKSVIVLGDFNDDLDETVGSKIQVGPEWPKSSYEIFTRDTSNYFPVTLQLSLNKETSMTGYSEVIDHIILSNELKEYYIKNSAQILDELANTIPDYSMTTSDHFPVKTRLRFDVISNLTAEHKEILIDIFPNPSDGLFKTKGIHEPTQLRIYDVTGRKRVSFNLDAYNTEFSLENLATGTYFGIMENSEGRKLVRLVKI
jgi:hypothetical protein